MLTLTDKLFDARSLTQKEEITIKHCNNLKTLSKCKKDKVAAILVSEDFNQIYSIGINGGPKGQDNCLCDSELSKFGCVHAEQNCLVKNSNTTDAKIMICTKEPCVTCAALIVNANVNIKEFWYISDYKDHRGLKILENANINVFKINV